MKASKLIAATVAAVAGFVGEMIMAQPMPSIGVRGPFLHGAPTGQVAGDSEQGYGTASEQRLYQLVRQPNPIAERQLQIEFLGADVEAFAFTFG